jgi:hypothetical protein
VGERVGRRLLHRGVVAWGIGRVIAGELLARCPMADAATFYDLARARRGDLGGAQGARERDVQGDDAGRLRDPVFRGFSSNSN